MKLRFNRFTLSNGLRVLVHTDPTTPMVAVNVLYDVGARDEDPNRTGFAHLFEHLMFGGSINIPDYDEPLQMAGGENNAYTTNDITNYYIQVPKQNLETALWLESDRMLSLAFSPESLEVQRKVVCEEFKEHYINKPYGNAWEHLLALAYKAHPYQWQTIGKSLKHVEDASLADVKAFFQKHYNPSNAILCIAGNITVAEATPLVEHWFGSIPPGERYVRVLPQEPEQTEARHKTIHADVPLDALYKAWHIPARNMQPYYACDLITEIMGNGLSSRLHQRLVKEQALFSSISCYHTGSLDPGLIVVQGKVVEGKSIEEADNAVAREMALLVAEGVSPEELQKAKNKVTAAIEFEDLSILSRANNLAFYELMGNANYINEELSRYQVVTREMLQGTAAAFLKSENCNTLYYRKKRNDTE
ncbi:MAG: insulinase family protein [Bacteroidetes bacterium]|nr:insulinase family protein [Bacteroidota bacterium]